MRKKVIFIGILTTIVIIIFCKIFHTKNNLPPSISNTSLYSKKNDSNIYIKPLNGDKKIQQKLYLMQKNEWKVNSFLDLLNEDQSANNKLPFTFVAWYKNIPIGSCSIEATNDLETTLTPWASHLYIKPDYRGKKIARRLIWKILEKAKELGYSKIFYVTNNPVNISIYKHLGGKIIKTTFAQGCEHTIMERDLNDINC